MPCRPPVRPGTPRYDRGVSAGELRTGVQRLVTDPTLADLGPRVGLLTNHTGVLPDLSRNVEALLRAGVHVVALFGPEHGLWGTAPAGHSESTSLDSATGLPVIDIYGRQGDDLARRLAAQRLSHLVVDLADVGTRCYTYIWSLFDALVAAATLDLPVTVLDRPNPISRLPPEGPGVADSCRSFVGRVNLPIVHGLTPGELARHVNRRDVPKLAGRPASLDVIEMTGWDRDRPLSHPVLPWVPPSPNIPTPATAVAYPGICLVEGTNVSEGRGTTSPLRQIGAGWVDDRLAAALNERALPGVRWRQVRFAPGYAADPGGAPQPVGHKWSGQTITGVMLHITGPDIEPVRTGVTLLQVLADLYPQFAFLPGVSGRPPFIDLLWGSDVLRTRLTELDYQELLDASPAPASPDPSDLLYPTAGRRWPDTLGSPGSQ